MVGYGRLAVGAQTSILQPQGHQVANLPTALVSNNFCYKQYAMLDTTDYMRQTIHTWEQLGFTFDFISIGFIASDIQAELLASFCRKQKEKGATILVDPIMADNGSMYSGLGDDTILRLRKIISLADICVPNYTEACYLTGMPYAKEGMDAQKATTLVNAVRALGARSVLITSARVDNRPAVAGYSAQSNTYLTLPYREVPVQFSGTGDIFTGMLIGKLLKGKSLEKAAQITMEQLSALIDTNQDEEHKYEGLPISV